MSAAVAPSSNEEIIAVRENSPPWPVPQRIALRFAVVFFSFMVFCGIPAFPGALLVVPLWTKVWYKIVPWVGTHLLRLPAITVFPNGSGDTTYNWVELLCYFVIAVIATVVWSLAAKRTNYDWLHDRFRVYLRYLLASQMFVYGFDKVFLLQMPRPHAAELAQPVGDLSPFSLLWLFMGASAPYQFFAGAAEALGGTLLLFRRTTTLGALILVGVMTNVVLLNFCYDVPVKLMSSSLLLVAIVLAAQDAPRLWSLLVLSRPVEPVATATTWRFPRVRRVVKTLVVLWMLLIAGGTGFRAYHMRKNGEPKRTAIDGVYNVESAPAGWLRVAILDDGLSITMSDDSAREFRLARDARSLTLTNAEDEKAKPQKLSFSWLDARHLVLDGELDGRPAHATLYKLDTNAILLRRGFHLVNEHPYAR